MKKTTEQLRFNIRWLNRQTLIILLLGLILPLFNAVAQTPMYASPTGTPGNTFPLNNTTNRLQSLYYYNSFTPALPAGNVIISKLYINVGAGSAGTFTNLEIKMGTSTATAVAGAWFPVTTVYSGNLSVPANTAGAWMEIPLQTPFIWDTTVSLVVDMSQGGYAGVGRNVATVACCGGRQYGTTTGATPSGFSANSGTTYIGIDAIPAIPCSGQVVAGAATATVTNACGAVPFNVGLSGNTMANGITYQWQSSPQGAGTWTNITGATGMSYTINNQTTATDYRCILVCTNSNTTATSTAVSVGQNPYTQCYCTPAYTTGCATYNLNSFKMTGDGASSINDLNTGCTGTGYADRTSVVGAINISQDASYDIEVNTTSTSTAVYTSIWIDYNKNGAFEPFEKLLSDLITSTSPAFAKASISIPDTAIPGITRMRVRTVYSSTGVDACATTTWGETHDYLVNIQAVTCYRPIDLDISDVAKDAATVTVTPNSKNAANVTYAYEVRTSGAPGSGATGLGVSGTATTNPFTITGLQPSTKYFIYVKTVCSSTDNSSWTKSDQITTMCNYATLITAPGKTICGPQKVDLTAIYDSGSVYWYDAKNNGNLLHTGAIFTTPLITANTSYWVRGGDITQNGSVQIGNGNETDANGWNFLYGYYNASKNQYIYTADELMDMGLMAGPITAIGFEVINEGGHNPRSGFSISLGSTTQTIATTNMINNNNLTMVYSNASQPLNKGAMNITFTTPFIWDGMSNIVVQVVTNNGVAYNTLYGTLKGHITPDNKTSFLYTYDNVVTSTFLNVNAPTSSAPWIYGSTSNKRPNTVFFGMVGCASLPVEVPIVITPKPDFQLSTDKLVSCEGGVSETVTITTNLGGYDTFVWTPSTGVSGNATTGWTFNTSVEQEYVLSASQSNGICEHLKTVRVFAGVNPQAQSSLSSSYDLCKNEIAEMKALDPIPASVTIGANITTTAATSEISAFVQSAKFSKQQYIYSAAELIAQGFTTSGYIKDLSFETINSGASLSNPKYTVRLKLTANTSFGNTTFETGNFSTVFSRVNHAHTFQGIQTITFDTPFYWDGQSNIVVEITQEGAGAGNNAETYYNTVVGNNVGMYATSALDENMAVGTLTTNRLNVKFGLTQSKVTWSPTSNLYLDAAATAQYTPNTDALKVYVVSSGAMNQVYTATLTAPSGCYTNKAVTVNVADVTTPIMQNQTFCQSTPVSNIVVTGGVNATYEFYNSATATTPITTISQTGIYYVESSEGKCKSIRVPFTVNITPLSLPSAQFTQVICGNGTVANLMASGVTGSQIKWYNSASATTPLATTQPLVDNTTYYASQVLGNCESGRVAVLVDINPTPQSLTPQTISLCGSLNYGNVNLNQIPGSELVWYQSATSQTPIPNTSQIVSGTYYVSQKVNGCESLRVQVIASSQGSVPAPTATIQYVCGSGTVAQLIAQILPNATMEWYNSATATTPLATTTPLVNGTYYVSQRVGNCVSVKVPVAVRVINTSAPAVAAFTLCQGATVADLDIPATTGTSYKWFINSTSTTELAPTDILQSGFYFVTRVENGCESLRTQVRITINSRPNSPVGVSPQEFKNYAEISNLVMNEPNVVWYATYNDAMNGVNPLSQNMPLVNGTTYYAVIIGANGCPSLPTPIKAEVVLGVNDFDLSKLKYYPNPVNDLLTITYADVITNVEVFDLNGRMVIKRDFDNQTVQLDFSNLSSGTYMLNIKTKENSQFVKIVRK